MAKNSKGKNITHLYKYMNMDCNKVWDILINESLFFYPPTKFNDPYDCKIQFNYDDCTESDFREIFTSFLRKANSTRPENDIIKEVDKIIASGGHMSERWRSKFREHAKRELQPDLDRMGLLCLSEDRDNILLWAHYADNHKGLCFEFDSKVLQEKYYCKKIEYEKKYISLKEFYWPFHNEQNEECARLLLLRKSEHWEYENEWRIIIDWQEIEKRGGTRLFKMPEHLLTGIILGLEMDKKDKEKVRDMIHRFGLKPKLYEAKKDESSFRLNIEEVPL